MHLHLQECMRVYCNSLKFICAYMCTLHAMRFGVSARTGVIVHELRS